MATPFHEFVGDASLLRAPEVAWRRKVKSVSSPLMRLSSHGVVVVEEGSALIDGMNTRIDLVRCLQWSTGTIRFTHSVTASLRDLHVVGDELHLVTTKEGRPHRVALSLRDGTVLFEGSVEDGHLASFDDGSELVRSGRELVLRVSRTGAEIWRAPLGSEDLRGVDVHGDRLLVSHASSPTLDSIDRRSGQLRWRHAFEGQRLNHVAVDGAGVCVSTELGVTVLDHDGHVAFRIGDARTWTTFQAMSPDVVVLSRYTWDPHVPPDRREARVFLVDRRTGAERAALYEIPPRNPPTPMLLVADGIYGSPDNDGLRAWSYDGEPRFELHDKFLPPRKHFRIAARESQVVLATVVGLLCLRDP